MNIRIIEVFVKMRELLLTHKDILLKLDQMEKKVDGHDRDVQIIFHHLRALINPPTAPRKRIGYQ